MLIVISCHEENQPLWKLGMELSLFLDFHLDSSSFHHEFILKKEDIWFILKNKKAERIIHC